MENDVFSQSQIAISSQIIDFSDYTIIPGLSDLYVLIIFPEFIPKFSFF
jgi:hypothetical protein